MPKSGFLPLATQMTVASLAVDTHLGKQSADEALQKDHSLSCFIVVTFDPSVASSSGSCKNLTEFQRRNATLWAVSADDAEDAQKLAKNCR